MTAVGLLSAVYNKGFITDTILDLHLIYDYVESWNILWENPIFSVCLERILPRRSSG